MTRELLRLAPAAAFVLGLQTTVALAQPPASQPPEVPANIDVPAGYTWFFNGHAVGTQNYVCLPTASGVAWKFVAPQATLWDIPPAHEQLTTHFLSANPVENGVARPTWQHSTDSSRVWGRAIASSTDSNYVEANAIPWLLLEVVGARNGPEGGSTLKKADYIHRVNTSGGVAPSSGCTQPADVGAIVLVPYAADYFFYTATPGSGR